MSTLRSSATIAARSVLTLAVPALVVALVRIVLNGVFKGQWHANWLELFKALGILAGGWFAVCFVYIYLKLLASAPAVQILMQEPPTIDESAPALSGFVAMEYHALILNRTFLVFIAPEGLYGWKVQGPVTANKPMYFKEYAERLEGPVLMRDLDAIRKLSDLKGGFFIPRSDIVSVNLIHGTKWGMSAIPHSGRIKILLVSGATREFILLGSVSPESIQQHISR